MGQRRKNEETVPEEETGGKFEPVAKLSNEQVDSKSGENETAKFTIRSKLMEYDSKNSENPYTNKGIGELKVLFNEQTKSQES